MNLGYLRYVAEVERAGSITKAARNLYMGQPNLSKAIRELEQEIGITIFRRTAKGVEPTRQGAEFLNYVHRILSQLDELEAFYKPRKETPTHLRLSVPRATYIAWAFSDFVNGLPMEEKVELRFRETGIDSVISDVCAGESDIGIIRCRKASDGHLKPYLEKRQLCGQLLREFQPVLLMSQRHPLAQYDLVPNELLAQYPEIMHGDLQTPSAHFSNISSQPYDAAVSKRIYVYDRGSQYDLLQMVAGAYMWVSPMPDEALTRNGFVTRSSAQTTLPCQDILISQRGHRFTHIEQRLIERLRAGF